MTIIQMHAHISLLVLYSVPEEKFNVSWFYIRVSQPCPACDIVVCKIKKNKIWYIILKISTLEMLKISCNSTQGPNSRLRKDFASLSLSWKNLSPGRFFQVLSPHIDHLFLPLLLADIVRMWHIIIPVQRVFLFTLINVILAEVIIWGKREQEAAGMWRTGCEHTDINWLTDRAGWRLNYSLLNFSSNFSKILLWWYNLIMFVKQQHCFGATCY